jgi:hypothetical protein
LIVFLLLNVRVSLNNQHLIRPIRSLSVYFNYANKFDARTKMTRTAAHRRRYLAMAAESR